MGGTGHERGAHHFLLQGAGETALHFPLWDTDRQTDCLCCSNEDVTMMRSRSRRKLRRKRRRSSRWKKKRRGRIGRKSRRRSRNRAVPVMVACWLRSSSPSEMCLTAASVCRLLLLLLQLLLLLLDFSEELQEEPALDSEPRPCSPAREGHKGGGASWSSPFNGLQGKREWEGERLRLSDAPGTSLCFAAECVCVCVPTAEE